MDPISVWHEAVTKNDLTAFAALVADDAVFESPAVHTPQAGKAKVEMYLRAALQVLNNGSFRYTDEWRGERSAVLEFVATVNGIAINGVDIVRWNEAGQVTGFKVIVRPFKGLTVLMEEMKKRLTPS